MAKHQKSPGEKQWPAFSDRPLPEFADRLPPIRADVWRRVQVGLWLLATTRMNLVGELSAEIAKKEGLDPQSSSLRELFYRYLPEAGLTIGEKINLFTSTGLSLVRLSNFGEEVCRAYGWEPKESEWARLIRLHDGDNQKEHTAMVLAYTREARARGFRAVVHPGVSEKVGDAKVQPDVYIVNRKHSRFYVEIERSGHFGRDREGKWRGMLLLQKMVAVVAQKQESRATLVKEIKALGLPGFAADLTSLRRRSSTGNPGPLWNEKW